MDLFTKRKKAVSWLGVLLVVSLVATACGGSAKKSDDGGGNGAAASDVDPNGVLKVALGLELPGGIHFDPAEVQGPTELEWMQLVEGTLLRVTPSGAIEPMMAKAYELVDPQTVQFTLREGMKFTDGAAYDAEAVKASLLRTRDQVSAAAKPSQDASIAEISEITVESPTALTVKLKTAVGGQFVGAMASTWGAVVSPKQAAAAPKDINHGAIGAGPYKIVSVVNNQSVTLTKNPDYWDAKSWRLGGIEFVNLPLGAAQINGLRTGAVDLALRMQPTDATPLTADPTIGVVSKFVENSYFYINMCMGKPPLDNEKVRQALNVGVDRDELNKLVFNGLGEPAYGLWPKAQSAYYEPTLKSISGYNPTKAKKLLSQAGTPKVTVDLYYSSQASPDYVRILEALQGQLAKVGITIKIIPAELLSQFVVPQKAGAQMIPASRSGVSKYLGVFGAGQRLALCGVAHQEIVEPLAPASAAVPGSVSIGKLFRAADVTIAEHAYLVPLIFVPRISAYVKARIGGTPEFEAVNSFPMFDSMYIKKKK